MISRTNPSCQTRLENNPTPNNNKKPRKERELHATKPLFSQCCRGGASKRVVALLCLPVGMTKKTKTKSTGPTNQYTWGVYQDILLSLWKCCAPTSITMNERTMAYQRTESTLKCHTCKDDASAAETLSTTPTPFCSSCLRHKDDGRCMR